MSKKCAFVMDRFLALDKNERLPLWMTFHLLGCKDCRSQVRMLSQAEKASSKDSRGMALFSAGTISDVLGELYPKAEPPKKVSLANWILTGILLLACMVVFTVVLTPVTTRLQVFLFLFLGILISVYCVLFVGANLDFFVKQTAKYDL